MRKTILLTAVAITTILAGCTNEDIYDIDKIQRYSSNFEEHFGEIAEGHTFNMVKAVNISANTSFSNFRLKVYDNTPNCGLGAHLLGDFKNLSGSTEVKCDVPSYVKTLYFAYEHDGLTHYSKADVTPDNRSKAEMMLAGTRAGGEANKDEFLATFSIFHQDIADRTAYPENPNITIPNDGNFDMTDLTANSDVPNKKWGVFSKAFYDFLEGTQGDGTYNGILPFNLFKHAEDHSNYASDFTFEYDAETAVNGVDWITFYPFEYEAGRHDIVGYYIYSIATGAILEHHDIYENNYEVDQYRLLGADDDIHVNNDPNFLGVLTSDNNINPYNVTGNAQNIIPFPSKFFNFDSYVDYYDGYQNITQYRINDFYYNYIDHRSGNRDGLLSNDNGFTFTANNCTKYGITSNGYEVRADQPIQNYHVVNGSRLSDNTFSFYKNIRLGKGFFKVVGYGLYRDGTNDQVGNNHRNSYAYLRTNDINNTGKVKQFTNKEATTSGLTYVQSIYGLAQQNEFPYNNDQYRPTHTNRDFGGFADGVPDEHFSEFWFKKWKGLADAATSEADRDEIQNKYASVRYFSVEEDNTVVQIGFDGRFVTEGSWFTGRNIQLFKLAERQPRWNCKAVLGKPCTVGLREGQGLGFYIKTRTYWNINQTETGETDLMEGYGQNDPKIAEGNRRSATLKRSDSTTPGMITYYSESKRNPDETKQCVYASLNINDPNSEETTHEYGVIGLEDWGLNEDTPSDKDYNDIMLLIEHKVTNNKETPMVYTIAYEDLGTTDDFDFNDLVLQVAHATGSNKATVKVKCAGGHLPIQLFFGTPGESYHQELWSSINRQAYGLGSATYTKNGTTYTADQVIINTNADTYVPALPLQYPNLSIDFDPVKTINNVPNGFTISEDAHEFNIVVTYDDDGHNGTQIRISPNVTGDLETRRIPQAIVLDTDSWIWPKERANVDVAYPRIIEWIRDATQTEWLNHPESEHIYEGTINKEERDSSN